MIETGSVPKPVWLRELESLWPAWKLEGAEDKLKALGASAALLRKELTG